MKRATIVGERKAEIVEVPTPHPKEDWVLVKVRVAPMCTEYKALSPGTPPLTWGTRQQVRSLRSPNLAKSKWATGWW